MLVLNLVLILVMPVMVVMMVLLRGRSLLVLFKELGIFILVRVLRKDPLYFQVITLTMTQTLLLSITIFFFFVIDLEW